MESNPFHQERQLSLSDGMSTIDLSSRSSNLYLDYPSSGHDNNDDPQRQKIRKHHKLRTSPKCPPFRSDDGEHHITKTDNCTHRRKLHTPIDSTLPRHNASEHDHPPSFIAINPSSRLYTCLFLLFAASAIVHAVVQGFQNMTHGRKNTYNNGQTELLVVDEMTADAEKVLNNQVRYDNRMTNENLERESSNINSSSESSASVLSRASQLSYLVSNLGAGDVVECYVLTRMAPLTSVVSTVPLGSTTGASKFFNNDNRHLNGDGVENDSTKQQLQEASMTAAAAASHQPSDSILVRKSGLAFRYRPRVASIAPNDNSLDSSDAPKYFEITLEYGPQRTGSTKSFESVPTLHIDTDSQSPSNKYVSWENEGRVYHSTHISNEWTEAYYMAPITGVVLAKILQHAVDYPRKRPRYQPFEVVAVPSGKLIVRSSGSDDFVWEMFRELADLYVEIDPLLIPPRGKLQFYVSDAPASREGEEEAANTTPKQNQPNDNVQRVKGGLEAGRAALFYERFYNCATAIKTGDYSMYSPPAAADSTTALSETKTSLPPIAQSVTTSANTTNLIANTESVLDENASDQHYSDDKNNTTGFKATDDTDTVQLIEDATNGTEAYLNSVDVEQSNDTESLHARLLTIDKVKDVHMENDNQPDEESFANSPQTELSNSTTDTDEDENGDIAETAQKLQQAAVEAAEAAAVVASTNSSAADSAAAASQAAEAAKKAADATIVARNKVASEGIVSGDGALATSILSTCFSDPKYGILQKGEAKKSSTSDNTAEVNNEILGNDVRDVSETIEVHETTYAYIYLDGDTFFRLNLTAPYWGTSSTLQTVPQPSLKPEGWGDTVDWAIFIFILTGALFGFVVMFHQGGCVIVDKRLQLTWFFKPTEHDKVDSVDESSHVLKRGGGFAHTIKIDMLPISMGGQVASHYSDNVESQLSTTDKGSNGVLLEMAYRCSESSNGTALGGGDNLPSSLRIRRDAPDQVERPTLMTTSKPVIPQQSPRDDDSKTNDKLVQGLQPLHKSGLPIVPPFS